MIPSVDERLASIVRALTEVILPHLPPEASLAQEQAQLAIGHIQIIRGQLDAAPAYEQEELADAIAIGTDLAKAVSGGAKTTAATKALAASVAGVDSADPSAANLRAGRQAILDAVEQLVRAVSVDGDATGKAALRATILDQEYTRTQKDRKWFAPFGFDSL